MPDYTVSRYGTDSSGRMCHDCGTESEQSRCERCARLHRGRARHRAAANASQSERALRSRWGRDVARVLSAGGDLIAFLDRSIPRDGECWVWPGARSSAGYATHGSAGSIRLAHRLVFSHANGPIEPGVVIHHACANRLCVRPDHLQAVTNIENVAEMFERKALLARIAHLEGLLAEAGIEA